jgi:hypothetical protein
MEVLNIYLLLVVLAARADPRQGLVSRNSGVWICPVPRLSSPRDGELLILSDTVPNAGPELLPEAERTL